MVHWLESIPVKHTTPWTRVARSVSGRVGVPTKCRDGTRQPSLDSTPVARRAERLWPQPSARNLHEFALRADGDARVAYRPTPAVLCQTLCMAFSFETDALPVLLRLVDAWGKGRCRHNLRTTLGP